MLRTDCDLYAVCVSLGKLIPSFLKTMFPLPSKTTLRWVETSGDLSRTMHNDKSTHLESVLVVTALRKS